MLAHHFSRAGLAEQACALLRARRRPRRCPLGLCRGDRLISMPRLPKRSRHTGNGASRSQRELALLLKQGPAHRHPQGRPKSRGRTGVSACATISRRASGDEHALFKALWGLWFSANLSAPNRRRHAIALSNWLRLGVESQERALFLEAIHCRWSTAFFRGDIAGLLADSREGIRHYDPQASQPAQRRIWRTRSRSLRLHRARTAGLAQFGYIRAKPKTISIGVSRSAKVLGNPNSLAFACMNAMTAYADHRRSRRRRRGWRSE